MYEIGDGIVRDMDQATYWYKKSSEEDDENNLEKLLNVKEFMLFIFKLLMYYRYYLC